MQVIGLCGYAGSGKDTAAEALVADGWQRVSFADPIREMALAIDPYVSLRGSRLSYFVTHGLGWEEAKKDPEVRRLLQRIGTEAGRNIHGEDVWVKMAIAKIMKTSDTPNWPNVVITDLRFQNEYDAIKQWFNTTIIRITRPGVGPVNDHESDQHLAGFAVDHELVNDGDKEKLWASIRAIAKGGE